ncbi:HAMP domain-containing sensor histidine kinase [Devosia sp. FJ2-5-3]|uniref:sensor histidine kinase n=1 Tax=Devosia sp. FJ2-5-3 TaxID=2976680 RepID=UPI0023D8B188|nr:HAMP domain-containing sensor histidine kinase [Devosia sp. FJ2-5-3]WEJ56895.1 HAMP domain-containing histidine kinase [Devosia sp. FJ2-5-3]
MKRNSLALRLMGLAILMVAGSLVLAGLVLQGLFVTNLERTVQADLDAALSRLVALIDPGMSEPTIRAPLPDPRYETPLGGRYWQIEALDTTELARSRSLFEQELKTPHVPDGETFHHASAGGLHLIMVSRVITIGGRQFRVIVGQDHDPIHQAGEQYGWDIAKLFALLAVVIIGAAWAQLQLGLLPLHRLRSAVDAVRNGDVSRLEGRFPIEVHPLVEEVNGLLADREALTERGRRRASDLAHGLKTPLAAMHGIAMRLRDRGEEQEAEALDDLALEMSARVDYQMRLASLRTRSAEHHERSSLNTVVLRTLAVLRKTERGEQLFWQVELDDDLEVDIHRQDLMELVGVTLENASKWAATTIVVQGRKDLGFVLLRVSDDGPGIASELIKKLGTRGARLDEAVPGTGLGLAIATEITELNGGSLSYARSDRGGLLVELRLPLVKV